jgi:hypothetical protein
MALFPLVASRIIILVTLIHSFRSIWGLLKGVWEAWIPFEFYKNICNGYYLYL